jgi:predicted nucleic acid-binding protein
VRPPPVVVDASVAGVFVFEEANTVHARRVFAAATRETHRLIAPKFWMQECGNTCLNYWRRRRITKAEAVEAFGVAMSLPVALLDTDHLLDAAFPTAVQYDLTTYDALYVVAAEYVDAPLVTTDDELIAALRRGHWPGRVMHASDWPGVA